MDLEKLANNIRRNENGLYYSKSLSNISYPEEGNEHCMQIEENSFWFIHRNNAIAEGVKKHNGDRMFFDIGGGNGFVAKRLQDEGAKVILVEPGEIGSLNAKKRGIDTVICATLNDAGFFEKSVESVGLFDVVEHIENDTLFLQDINKYMKDDALIYITVPAYNFLWSNEDNDAGHFRRYTTKSMNTLLEKCGFTVIQSTYIFSILPIPVFLFRSLPSKLGFNKNSKSLQKHQKEHEQKKGILNGILNKIWNWELSRIRKNKKIPVGGSCFVIAKKVATHVQ